VPGILDLCRRCPVERGSRVALSHLSLSLFLSFSHHWPLIPFSLSLPLAIALSLAPLVYYIRGALRTAHVLEVNLFRGLLRCSHPGISRFPEDVSLKTSFPFKINMRSFLKN